MKENKKRSVIFTIAICIFLFICKPYAAYCDSKYKSPSNETLLWRTPLYLIANRYIELFLHESGHALSLMAFGRKIDSFEISLLTGGRVNFTFSEEEKSKHFENVLINLAGPIVDRLLAFGVNRYLDANEYDIPEELRSFLGTTYIYTSITSYLYFLASYLFYLLPIIGGKVLSTDWTNIAYELSEGNYTVGLIIMTLFAAAYTVDLIYTIDEIEKNYDRMIGKYPASIRSGVSIAGNGDFKIKLISNGAAIEQTFRF
jgi:hypothetical protein